MELTTTEKRFWNKWKGPIVVAAIVLLLLLGLLAYYASSAEAASQNLNYTITWTPGAIAPDGSNKPDGFKVMQRYRDPGAANFTNWAEIGQVAYSPTVAPLLEDSIINDPGNRVICYAVFAYNTGGSSEWTPEACITTPTPLVVPSRPNGGRPVTVIMKVPVTVQAPPKVP